MSGAACEASCGQGAAQETGLGVQTCGITEQPPAVPPLPSGLTSPPAALRPNGPGIDTSRTGLNLRSQISERPRERQLGFLKQFSQQKKERFSLPEWQKKGRSQIKMYRVFFLQMWTLSFEVLLSSQLKRIYFLLSFVVNVIFFTN